MLLSETFGVKKDWKVILMAEEPMELVPGFAFTVYLPGAKKISSLRSSYRFLAVKINSFGYTVELGVFPKKHKDPLY